MSDLSDLLRGTADLIDAVRDAYREQSRGFSEREAGDYLDTAGLDDAIVPVPTCGEQPAYEPVIPPAFPIRCDLPAAHVGEHISYEHPDRAIVRWPRASVSPEHLAAHITASRRAAENDGYGGTAVDDWIAADLLARHHITYITKK